MSWLNLAVRSLGMFILLPAVLAVATPADAVVWLLLANASFFVTIADFGVLPTATRAVAYATVTTDDAAAGRPVPVGSQTMGEVLAASRYIYSRVAAVAFVVFLVAGLLFLPGPVAAVSSPPDARVAAVVVLAGSTAAVYGNLYVAYLTGVDEVARTQRWLALTGLAGLALGGFLLLVTRDVFTVTIAQQAGLALGILVCAWRAHRHAAPDSFRGSADARSPVVRGIWAGAWRSGIAGVMTSGSLQVSNLMVAQFAEQAAAAGYLLTLRLMQAVSQFSQAPFYSRLPVLAKLHAMDRATEKFALAATCMRRSYWTYVAGLVVVGLLVPPALAFTGSSIVLSSPLVTGLLALAILGERYGAMHIQLYSTTNHILWHVAALRQFAGFAAAGLMLAPLLGLVAIPLALLVANWALYARYCVRRSYALIPGGAWRFERSVLIAPLLAAVACIVVTIGLSYL